MPAPILRLVLRRTFVAAALVAAGCTPSQLEPLPWPEAGPEGLSGQAWTNALAAHREATVRGFTTKQVLAVIDFSRPSSQRRLWVVDLNTGQVLLHEHVAHGVRSGGLYASAFSNRDGSNQSSLGAFVTANAYIGVRGLSLRLRGLESGINDRAWARGIVLHGTPGVSDVRARQGRLGRTEGCPAVSMAVVRRLVSLVEDGVVVFAWYPDRNFLARSEFVSPGAALLSGS